MFYILVGVQQISSGWKKHGDDELNDAVFLMTR